MDPVNLIMRIVHVGSAMLIIGGWVYVLLVLNPAFRVVDPGFAESIRTVARRRFYRVLHLGLGVAILSGIYNFFFNLPAYRNVGPPGLVHGLLGLKILLGIAILVIVVAQSMNVLSGSSDRWVKINLALATIIFIAAAVVRQVRLETLMGS